ncbi:MAG: beta-ketoacyl-[acyl-carrier-protein] synthase family protein [Microthrixaceae bacterium]
MTASTPVAITGYGEVTPLGIDADTTLDAVDAGGLGIRPAPWSGRRTEDGGVTEALFAGVPSSFDERSVLGERLAGGCGRQVAFGIAAAEEALERADLDPRSLPPERTAVVDGTSMAGMYPLMLAQHGLERRGVQGVPPKTMLTVWSNMTAAQLCIRHGLHGPSLTITTACASALDAINHAAGLIRAGVVDVALCGGTEGGWPLGRPGSELLVPATAVGARILGMESPSVAPDRASLPFDVDRKGIVFGEGAGWFVLESEDHRRRRGAVAFGWLVGSWSCADAHHPSSPAPDGEWEAHVMATAQRQADIEPRNVDVVFAHATGTPLGDIAEATALRRVFTDGDGPVVTCLKGHLGHTGASSGAMATVSALRALGHGTVNPIRGTDRLDPAIDLDVVLHRPRRLDVAVAQVNAFGFGGQNASIVLRHPTAHP